MPVRLAHALLLLVVLVVLPGLLPAADGGDPRAGGRIIGLAIMAVLVTIFIRSLLALRRSDTCRLCTWTMLITTGGLLLAWLAIAMPAPAASKALLWSSQLAGALLAIIAIARFDRARHAALRCAVRNKIVSQAVEFGTRLTLPDGYRSEDAPPSQRQEEVDGFRWRGSYTVAESVTSRLTARLTSGRFPRDAYQDFARACHAAVAYAGGTLRITMPESQPEARRPATANPNP